MKTLPSEKAGETRAYSPDDTFSSLARGERRRVLQYLLEAAPESVPRKALATALAAATHGKSREDVTDEERRNATIALHHRHLPSLTAAGLVDYATDDNTVTLAEHPALRDPGVLEAVRGATTASSESLNALFGALADGQRRTILDILSHQFGRIHVETLARDLEARERDVAESDVSDAGVKRALTRLRHADLPHLAEAALVEYDPEAETVAYTGHPVLRVPWMHSMLARVPTESHRRDRAGWNRRDRGV